MNGPDRDETQQALADVLHRMLQEGATVEVSRLGTFGRQHQAARLERQPDGQLAMQPPKNIVTFEPAPDLS